MLPHIENLTKVAKIIQSSSRVKHIGRITKKKLCLREKKSFMFMKDWVNVNNHVMSHNIKQYKLRTPQNKAEQSQFSLKRVESSFVQLQPDANIPDK